MSEDQVFITQKNQVFIKSFLLCQWMRNYGSRVWVWVACAMFMCQTGPAERCTDVRRCNEPVGGPLSVVWKVNRAEFAYIETGNTQEDIRLPCCRGGLVVARCICMVYRLFTVCTLEMHALPVLLCGCCFLIRPLIIQTVISRLECFPGIRR